MTEDALQIVGKCAAELVFVGVFCWPGWLILRVLSRGRYPPRKPYPHSEEFVAAIRLTGVIVIVVLVAES